MYDKIESGKHIKKITKIQLEPQQKSLKNAKSTKNLQTS